MFSTGERPKIKDVRITNEKNVTPEDIVKEAMTINKKLRLANIPPGDDDRTERFMTEIRKDHKEFCESYPIVLRYMCQMRQFSAKALQKYLAKIAAKPWSGQEEYLDSQADYVVILYKELHPRWQRKEVTNLRQNVRKIRAMSIRSS